MKGLCEELWRCWKDPFFLPPRAPVVIVRLWVFSSGAAGGDVNPRQRPQPGLPQLTGSRVQTRPQGHHDSVIHPLQPDEGREARSSLSVSTFAADSSPHPASSSSSSPGAVQVHLMVAVVGRLFQKWFPAQPNLSYTFIWDKTDAYGQRVYGLSEAVGAFPLAHFEHLFVLLSNLNYLHCWNPKFDAHHLCIPSPDLSLVLISRPLNCFFFFCCFSCKSLVSIIYECCELSTILDKKKGPSIIL